MMYIAQKLCISYLVDMYIVILISIVVDQIAPADQNFILEDARPAPSKNRTLTDQYKHGTFSLTFSFLTPQICAPFSAH